MSRPTPRVPGPRAPALSAAPSALGGRPGHRARARAPASRGPSRVGRRPRRPGRHSSRGARRGPFPAERARWTARGPRDGTGGPAGPSARRTHPGTLRRWVGVRLERTEQWGSGPRGPGTGPGAAWAAVELERAPGRGSGGASSPRDPALCGDPTRRTLLGRLAHHPWTTVLLVVVGTSVVKGARGLGPSLPSPTSRPRSVLGEGEVPPVPASLKVQYPRRGSFPGVTVERRQPTTLTGTSPRLGWRAADGTHCPPVDLHPLLDGGEDGALALLATAATGARAEENFLGGFTSGFCLLLLLRVDVVFFGYPSFLLLFFEIALKYFLRKSVDVGAPGAASDLEPLVVGSRSFGVVSPGSVWGFRVWSPSLPTTLLLGSWVCGPGPGRGRGSPTEKGSDLSLRLTSRRVQPRWDVRPVYLPSHLQYKTSGGESDLDQRGDGEADTHRETRPLWGPWSTREWSDARAGKEDGRGSHPTKSRCREDPDVPSYVGVVRDVTPRPSPATTVDRTTIEEWVVPTGSRPTFSSVTPSDPSPTWKWVRTGVVPGR